MRKNLATWVLSIDPSINYLGWALWKKGKLHQYGLLTSTTITGDNKLQMLTRCREMIEGLWDVLDKFNVTNVQIVTEIPDNFGAAGYMSRESGAISKLYFLAGMIFNMTDDVHTYLPREWKGTMNKCICTMRLSQIPAYKKILLGNGIVKCKVCKNMHPPFLLRHDITDAIGVGQKYIHGKI